MIAQGNYVQPDPGEAVIWTVNCLGQSVIARRYTVSKPLTPEEKAEMIAQQKRYNNLARWKRGEVVDVDSDDAIALLEEIS